MHCAHACVFSVLKEDLSAESNVPFISSFLNLFGRSVSDLLFILCDNESNNKKIADILRVPMIGCASHRFNLVIKLYLLLHENRLAKVNELMKNLQTLKQRAMFSEVHKLIGGD